MNAQRKKIIISEIIYWKKNKMLPEHYCDFLITLYAQGEEEQKSKIPDAVLVQEKKRFLRSIYLLSGIVLLAMAALFIFDRFPEAALTAGAALTFILLMRTFTKQTKLTPFLYIAASFLLLFLSLKLWLVFFNEQTMLLLGLLLLNCILWLLAGKMLNLLYFTISGVAGLLLIIIFLFYSF